MAQVITPIRDRRAEIPELPPLAPPEGWTAEERWDGALVMTAPDGLVVKGGDTHYQGRRVRTVVVSRGDVMYPSVRDIEQAWRFFFGDVIVALEHGILPDGRPMLTLAHSPDWTPEHASRVGLLAGATLARFRQAEQHTDVLAKQPDLPAPPGWEKRTNPLSGRPMYLHKSLRVVVSEEKREGRLRRTVSISHGARRSPRAEEVKFVVASFLHGGVCQGVCDFEETPVHDLPVPLLYLTRDRRPAS